MDIAIADIVASTAGRDRGRLFYVVSTEGEYLRLADGRKRKVDDPKRKKRKHVCKITRTDSGIAQRLRAGEPVLNSELRRDLAANGQKINSQNQGG